MSGLTGLKEQGITNCVTLQFITNYDKLFLERDEPSPHSDGFQMVRCSVASVVVVFVIVYDCDYEV